MTEDASQLIAGDTLKAATFKFVDEVQTKVTRAPGRRLSSMWQRSFTW
jgi:hypothetical protein